MNTPYKTIRVKGQTGRTVKIYVKKDETYKTLPPWYIAVKGIPSLKYDCFYVHEDGEARPTVFHDTKGAFTGRFDTKEAAQRAVAIYCSLLSTQ